MRGQAHVKKAFLLAGFTLNLLQFAQLAPPKIGVVRE
jgi:hypothetical protein